MSANNSLFDLPARTNSVQMTFDTEMNPIID